MLLEKFISSTGAMFMYSSGRVEVEDASALKSVSIPSRVFRKLRGRDFFCGFNTLE